MNTKHRSLAKGQAVVESLFAVLLFVVILCVISSLSCYLFMQFNLVTAAREGSRAASINPDLAGANSAAAIATVKSRVESFFLQATGQTIADNQITVTTPTGTAPNRVTSVTVTFNFTSPVNIPGLLGAPDLKNLPLTATASMRYEE